jgi:hypothetical protein
MQLPGWLLFEEMQNNGPSVRKAPASQLQLPWQAAANMLFSSNFESAFKI